jgi:hypothetical protein
MRLGDRQVVDVDLAARPLELLQLVGHQPADHLAARERDQGGHVVASEESREVGLARRLAAIGLRVLERHAEQRVEAARERQVGRGEAVDGDGLGHRSILL